MKQPSPNGFPKRGYLAAGLCLRLLLAPFLSHPFDMRVFMAVGAAVANGMTPYGQYNLQTIFASTPHRHLFGTLPGIGYPPPWGLLSGLLYRVSSVLAPNNLYAYVLALKIPIILAELIIAILIYNILKEQTDERVASKGFLLFLFCPFVIAVGTVWGMFDALALLFALFSAYTLHGNWRISSLSLSVASVLKVFPLTLVPLYSVLLYRSARSAKLAFQFLALTAGITCLFTVVPMIAFGWPISNLYNALIYHFTTTNPSYDNQMAFPYGAASPFNVFALANDLTSGTFQPPWVAIYFWIPACIAVYVLLLRVSRHRDFMRQHFTLTAQWSLLLLLTLFTTRVWVSEQNLMFLFAFLALSVFLQNREEALTVRLLWILLFSFVMVHVPAIAFSWLPIPWMLDAATSFADGAFGWTRLLIMTLLTFGWVAVSWHYVARKLRWEH